MTTKAIRRKSDPFVKRSTLRFLTMGETPSVRAVALQLHCGMVTALREGDGTIHATWGEVAAWAGVSYASVKRAVIRLREKGWIRELSGHRIVFDYSRSMPTRTPSEKAQFEPCSNKDVKPSGRDDSSHPIPPADPMGTGHPPSGEDVPLQAGKDENPSVFSQVVTAICAGGADRAGAVKAARNLGHITPATIERVSRIVSAVAGLPVKPYRPGALIVAAVRDRRLGDSLLAGASRKPKREAVSVPVVPASGGDSWSGGWDNLAPTPEELEYLRSRGYSVPVIGGRKP